MTGSLYLVSTPIGNLGDISKRALQKLSEVDFIASEDTRVTLKLLIRFNIKKQLISYHEYNRRESGLRIINRILMGENCALVTDAGTPGISDPGEDLVILCIESGIPVIAIPGPCAAVTALTLSGLPSGRFTFEGFLSTVKKSRFEHLNELKTEKRTMIFYEAPHKLNRTLNDMLTVLGDRRVSISRELTKLYEETLRCSLSEAIAHYEQTTPRGEFVLILEGAQNESLSELDFTKAAAVVNNYVDEGFSLKDAVKKAAEETGVPKNALYKATIKQVISKK